MNAHLGTNTGMDWAKGDFNYDSAVGSADSTLLSNNQNNTFGSSYAGYGYTAPSGTTDVYLEPTGTAGSVGIHLGASGNTLVATLTNANQLVFSQLNGVTIHDEVPVVFKPAGLSFIGAGDSTLQIQMALNDRSIDDKSVELATFGNALVTLDETDAITNGVTTTSTESYGIGISTLKIKTNGFAATSAAGGTTVTIEDLAQHLVVDTGTGSYNTINIGFAAINNQNDGYSVDGAVILVGGANNTVNLTSGDSQVTATVDFSGGAGLGNILDVGYHSTATLAIVGNVSHRIFVATVNVDLGNLIIADPSTITDIEDLYGMVYVNAPSTITAFLVSHGSAAAYVQASSTIGTLTVSDYGVAQIPAASTIGTLTVNDTANVFLNQTFIGTSISVNSLVIGLDGLLDIGTSFLYVNNVSTLFSKVHQYIDAGYNRNVGTGIGDYNGRGGITSSAVKPNLDFMGIGYYNGELQDPNNPDNVGQTLGRYSDSGHGTGIALNTIFIRPILTADLNGDGVVNSYDVTLFNSFGLFGQFTDLGYQAGDLNGDGKVDAKDVDIFNSAGNFNNGSYN